VTAFPFALLLQASTDPAGPAQWTGRNWLGLGCQVVVFILLVAFIFWLADLKHAGPEQEGEETAPGEGGSAEPPKPEAEEPPPASGA